MPRGCLNIIYLDNHPTCDSGAQTVERLHAAYDIKSELRLVGLFLHRISMATTVVHECKQV